jgi:hypothetical protein
MSDIYIQNSTKLEDDSGLSQIEIARDLYFYLILILFLNGIVFYEEKQRNIEIVYSLASCV